MRADMYEVIIERPRGGAGWGRPERRVPWQKLDRDDGDGGFDGGPGKLRMGPRRRSKWLSENLAPLVRFLRSRVGQPWDTVHSEIAAHIAVRSAVQKHVLDHLRGYVEQNPVFIHGWPHHPRSLGIGGWPLCGISSFYVCPQTGLLCAPTVGRMGHDIRPLDARTELRCIHGVWFLIELADVPADPRVRERCRDALLARSLAHASVAGRRGLLSRMYGRPGIYAVRKEPVPARQLGALLQRAAEYAASF